MTDLLLIRHGQATHNQGGRIVGRERTHLTEEGRQQARALARQLALWSPSIAHLYTSPQQRARQTAVSIGRALGVTPILDDRLREFDFGRVSGLTMDGFRQTMPEVYARWEDHSDLSFQFPGGEQRLAVLQRIAQMLDEIVTRHPGEPVAVVTHSGTLRAGLGHLLPETMGTWWAYPLDNASLTHVSAATGQNVLVALNDCQHLCLG
jgi:broad specificity phosphatase PhoE